MAMLRSIQCFVSKDGVRWRLGVDGNISCKTLFILSRQDTSGSRSEVYHVIRSCSSGCFCEIHLTVKAV